MLTVETTNPPCAGIPTLTYKAAKVARFAAMFDPMLLLTLLSLIVNIIRLVKECQNTPRIAHVIIRKPSFFQQARLRKMVKRDFPANSSEVEKMLKIVGAATTPAEVVALFSEETLATEEVIRNSLPTLVAFTEQNR